MRKFVQSVGTKLFAVVFCGIVVCVLSVGLFSYSQSESIIRHLVKDSSANTVAAASEKLDLMFGTIENISTQLVLDTSMNEAYMSLAYDRDTSVLLRIESKLIEVMRSNVDVITGAAFIPINSDISGVAVGSAQLDLTAADQLEWVMQTVETNGEPIWLPLQPDGFGGNVDGGSIGLSRLIKIYEHRFVILLEIPVTAISDQLSGLRLPEGMFQIMDASGGIVYSEDADRLTEPFLSVLPAEGEERQGGTVPFDNVIGQQMLGVYQTFGSMDWMIAGLIPVESLLKEARTIRELTWIMALVAVLIAVLIGYLVMRMVARPLAALQNLMNEGKQGNLTVRSTIDKQDEIGQLAASFNEMMENITLLVTEANRSAQDVLGTSRELAEASRKTAQSAKEIAQATEDIARGSSNLALEAERGSMITGEMEQRLQHVIEANAQMNDAAGSVDQASEQGMRYMVVLIDKTELAERMTQDMSLKVTKLKDSAHSIRHILEMLHNITKQTNILSLNATIEASRAGNAGRGFMVVADEIRKLAAQSQESIDIAGQIVEAVEQEVEAAVSTLAEAHPIYRAQLDSVQEADEMFRTVRSNMTSFVAQLNVAADSIVQLRQTQQTLTDTMGSVSAVAQEASATTEQVASVGSEQISVSDNLITLANRLESVSNQLQHSLSRFRTQDKV